MNHAAKVVLSLFAVATLPALARSALATSPEPGPGAPGDPTVAAPPGLELAGPPGRAPAEPIRLALAGPVGLALAGPVGLALAGPGGTPPRNRPDLRPALPHEDDTHCERCHTTDGWTEVAFAHERTGFPLRGAHAKAGCKACHTSDFTRALGRDCLSCHRDAHQGRLGARCASCHEETSWRTRFDADAHRRGNFPLTGRHAFMPCEECHGDRRDRGFSRPTPACIDCHRRDWERTAATAVDHRAAGFSTECRSCHEGWRFTGATFPQHEACFQIGSGKHAGIRCLSCHTSVSGLASTGACSSGTASCTRCHSCGSHPSEPGFACAERKCYECHRFANAAAPLRAGARRSR